MYKFHDTTTRMRTHTHDHRLQSDINTILIITNQVEITITIITISSVDTQHPPAQFNEVASLNGSAKKGGGKCGVRTSVSKNIRKCGSREGHAWAVLEKTRESGSFKLNLVSMFNRLLYFKLY